MSCRKISETFSWLNAKNIRDGKGRRPSDPVSMKDGGLRGGAGSLIRLCAETSILLM